MTTVLGSYVQYKMSDTGESGDAKISVICRLCAGTSEEGLEIYSEKGQEICLPEKISKCLPIVVSLSRYLGLKFALFSSHLATTPCIYSRESIHKHTSS